MIVPNKANPVVYDSTIDATHTGNGQIANSTLINCSGTANSAFNTNLTNFSGRINTTVNCTGSDVTLLSQNIKSCRLSGNVTAMDNCSATVSYIENLYAQSACNLYSVSGDKATGDMNVYDARYNEIDAVRINLYGQVFCDNIKATTIQNFGGTGYIQGKDISASTVALTGVTLGEGMNITGNSVTISSCSGNNVSVLVRRLRSTVQILLIYLQVILCMFLVSIALAILQSVHYLLIAAML